MSHRKKRRYVKGEDREKRMVTIGQAMERMLESMDAGRNFQMVRLWRSWGEVMGDLSDLARPMGYRGRTLLLGGDDAIAMQELQYYGDEILSRVNGFLGQDFFDKVRFDLIGSRIPLDEM